ncbi:MAG: SRPBCC family protein, partial [Gammaproteobacteria bacterium]
IHARMRSTTQVEMKPALLRSHNNIMIKRKVEDVYQFVAVDFFQNYRKWSPEVSELEQITRGAMRVGVTGRQVRYDLGYRSEATFRVTRLLPLRELRFASLSIPEFDVCYRFEPVTDATRLSFEFQLRLPLLMLPLQSRVDDIIKRGGNGVVNNLQALLEAD